MAVIAPRFTGRVGRAASYKELGGYGRRVGAVAAPPFRGEIEFVTSVERARTLADELVVGSPLADEGADDFVANLDAKTVALDCEGVRLGRFGRLCVMQIAVVNDQRVARKRASSHEDELPAQRLFLMDALRRGLVEAMAPVLESRDIVKVIHDCREDSSALLHQYGVRLRAVFDTQAAHAVLLRRAGQRMPYQSSCTELLRQKIGVEDPLHIGDVKKRMLNDDKLWARRPLGSALVSYALHGVAHLVPLRRALLQEALTQTSALAGNRRSTHKSSPTVIAEMAQASERALQYRHFNEHYDSAVSMAKIGQQLWALVAARTATGIYLKLNAGRVGLVCTPSAISRFEDVQLGDAVLCCVSGVSVDGKYIYLDRYDDDWDFFDHQRRPAGEPEVGAFGREHRHQSSLIADSFQAGPAGGSILNSDPLFLRGLPAADRLADGAGGLDAWEADPDDMGLPHTYED